MLLISLGEGGRVNLIVKDSFRFWNHKGLINAKVLTLRKIKQFDFRLQKAFLGFG